MSAADQEEKKPVRVWVDGCFDMAHFGHMNALRQAKELGDYLVVGVHSDADIERHKGPPVMNERERYEAVRGCKWVDEVVEAAPYVTQLETLDEHNIDFCVHGEDITTDEFGNDCYAIVKAAGRYRTIRRAQGVSSTDLVGRMLLLTKEHHERGATGPRSSSPYTKGVPFLPSSRMLAAFSQGSRAPTDDDVIVYVDGAFDLFNVAHVSALRKAKELGTYLIVGIHDDETVNRSKGLNYPLQSLHERVLSVLATRYADEVITGAPWNVDEGLLNTLRVSIVASGSVCDFPDDELADPYAVARRMGVFRRFESDYPELTTRAVVERVLAHRVKFEERNRRKERGELAMIEQLKKTREDHERALQEKAAAAGAAAAGAEEEKVVEQQ